MAIQYYDDAIIDKIQKWLPNNNSLRILKADDVKRALAVAADDNSDRPFSLPAIVLTRNKDIELLSNIKQNRSFEGLKLISTTEKTLHLNIIPIKVQYQLDIYTKTFEEGDEYLREFLFKLINNPSIIINIPYNDMGDYIKHIANIRVLDTVSDTSDISERIFAGQFTRWTIQMELHDAFLFGIPYRKNWTFDSAELGTPGGTEPTYKKS